MNQKEKENLEAAGFRVGDAKDFVNEVLTGKQERVDNAIAEALENLHHKTNDILGHGHHSAILVSAFKIDPKGDSALFSVSHDRSDGDAAAILGIAADKMREKTSA